MVLLCVAGAGLAGCVNDQVALLPPAPIDPTERECLLRAMYFESNRSSYDGLMAVGTVVMNRKETGRWGNSVCEVVGKKNQFAPGALTRKVSPRESVLAEKAADAVMAGQRHANMDYVMYFHTAGLHFPYSNMHYRLVAGGNAFYERYPRVPKLQSPATMVASGDAAQQPAAVVVANAAEALPPVAAASATPAPGVATVPAIATASTGSSFVTAPTPQPGPADGTSPVVAAPQNQTTLAYAATPAQAAPDPASPLFKALTSALSDGRQPAPTAPVQSADASPPAGSQPAAVAPSPDTSAPVPR